VVLTIVDGWAATAVAAAGNSRERWLRPNSIYVADLLTRAGLQIFAAVAKHSLCNSSGAKQPLVPYSRGNFSQRRTFSFLREEIPTDPNSQVSILFIILRGMCKTPVASQCVIFHCCR
jgi:hypothetical protein